MPKSKMKNVAAGDIIIIKTITNFCAAWQSRDWKEMLEYTQLTWRLSSADPQTVLETLFRKYPLIKWKILAIKRIGEAGVDVVLRIKYKIESGCKTEKIKVRTIRETAPYTPDAKNGEYGVNPLSMNRTV